MPAQKGATPLSRTFFCAFDVETTGLSAFSRLLEIGEKSFQLKGPAEEFSSLVEPGRPIPIEPVAVHGIDDEAVSGAPKAGQAIADFLHLSSSCVLVAHNASLDVGVMAVEASRSGLSLPEEALPNSIGPARSCLPGLPDYRLSTLAEALGMDDPPPQRSLADARVVARIVEEAAPRIEDWPSRPWSRLAAPTTSVRSGDFAVDASPTSAGLALLQEAAEDGRAAYIVYEGGTKEAQPRLVTPLGLLARGDFVFLKALCHLDGVSKSFRLSASARWSGLEALSP